MDRVTKAKELFKTGYNCAQSVVGAYSDLFGMSAEDAMRAAEGFGGGMGRQRLTCGAVSGMVMLAGLKYSKATAGDIENRTLIYETVRKMTNEFKQQNNTIMCRDLLGIDRNNNEGARPDKRTEEYYKKRPCLGCIGNCAEIIERILL
jgi:C_GCAxxG_C_C family probable redox protein